jgi:hypothetical protein
LKAQNGWLAFLLEGCGEARRTFDMTLSGNVIEADRDYGGLALETCRLPGSVDFFLSKAIGSLGFERYLSVANIVAFGQDEWETI